MVNDAVKRARAAWLYSIQQYQDESRMAIDVRLVDSRRIPCLNESRHRELIEAINRNRDVYEAELYLEGVEPIRRHLRPTLRLPEAANE